MIRKRMGEGRPYWNCDKRYFSVCLVLNGDTENELCTNTPEGFNHDTSNYITWCMPTENVRTVELVFRDHQHGINRYNKFNQCQFDLKNVLIALS